MDQVCRLRFRWLATRTPILALALIAVATPAPATFHLMLIEQVIAGVNGDTRAQAIQLRMRFDEQGILGPGRLVARDARGRNPVVLVDFSANVTNAAVGDRILIASDAFESYSVPTAQPDFKLAANIPDAYLEAGSLTFETDDGTLTVFRVCWGGASYTGPTTGSSENDDNGDYGPAFDGSLPTSGLQALRFQGSAGDVNRSSAVSFALTAAAAEFTSNARTSVSTAGCTSLDRDLDGNGRCDDTPVPTPADDTDPATDEALPSDDSATAVSCGQCGPGTAAVLGLAPVARLVLRRRPRGD
jgi:hypothetical protein